jgi:hypothetical protein
LTIAKGVLLAHKASYSQFLFESNLEEIKTLLFIFPFDLIYLGILNQVLTAKVICLKNDLRELAKVTTT